MEKKLAIVMPHQGQFQFELSHLFWRIELPDDLKPIYLASKSTDLVTSRNRLIKYSLDQPEIEWILTIDSDQVVNPSVPKRLVSRAREEDIKVLSALTFIYKNKLPTPVLPKSKDGTLYFNWIEATGMIETNRVGTGCLLVHRSVFDEVEKPWFMNEYDKYGMRTEAEDFYFSKKCIEAGIDLFIDGNIVVGHVKKVDLKDYTQILSHAIECEDVLEFLEGMGLVVPEDFEQPSVEEEN